MIAGCRSHTQDKPRVQRITVFVRQAFCVFVTNCFFFMLLSCISDDSQDDFSKGMDLLFDGRYEDAESHFLYLAREFSRSTSSDSKLNQAMALYKAGRIERLYLGQPRRAITRYREALELSPGASFAFDARREIALIFHDRLRDYRSAVIELEQLVQSFPDRKDIDHYRFRIAQGYFLLRDFDQSRSAAQSIVGKGANDPVLLANAMLLIANSYYAQSMYEQAVETHKQLLSIKPGDDIESRSSFELGMCYLELGDFRTAEQYLLRALERHTRPDIVRYQLMILQERMSEEDDKSLAKLPSATAGRKLVIEVKSQGSKSPDQSIPGKISSRPSKKQPIAEKETIRNTQQPASSKSDDVGMKPAVGLGKPNSEPPQNGIEGKEKIEPNALQEAKNRKATDVEQGAKKETVAPSKLTKSESISKPPTAEAIQQPDVAKKKPVDVTTQDSTKNEPAKQPAEKSTPLKSPEPPNPERSKPTESSAPELNNPVTNPTEDRS